MVRLLRSAALGTAMLLVVVQMASAQRPGGQPGRGPGGFGGFGGFGGGFGADPIQLLNLDAIKRELEIESDQVEQIDRLRDEMDTEMRELRRKLGEKYLTKVEGVLLPHQAERLQEITIQLQGTDALLSDRVAKKLGLSDDQRKKLVAKRDELNAKMRESVGPQRGGGERPDFDAIRERMETLRKERDEALLSILSAQQKEQFTKMQGEPFDRAQLFQGGGRRNRPDAG
jgi:hypothetical protein